MFKRYIASVKLRWIIGGFLGAFLVVCYQLSATSIEQKLMANKEYIQTQVNTLKMINTAIDFSIYYEY
jgi:hypothetical protein